MTQEYAWGSRSSARLATVELALVAVMDRALEMSPFDLTVVCGARSYEDQTEAYRSGFSKVPWPKSAHNITEENPLSRAVDVVPVGSGWKDDDKLDVMAGVIFAAAKDIGLEDKGWDLVWGGDWDGDWNTNEERWRDKAHFEIRRKDGAAFKVVETSTIDLASEPQEGDSLDGETEPVEDDEMS